MKRKNPRTDAEQMMDAYRRKYEKSYTALAREAERLVRQLMKLTTKMRGLRRRGTKRGKQTKRLP